MAVSDWSTTAANNGSTLGIDISEGCDAANINNALREMMAQLKAAVANIPTGTVMPFYQATAPTGWTKLTIHDNKALRVVSGSGGVSGGTVDFSTAFASKAVSGTTDGHALTINEMPAHQHGDGVGDTGNFAFTHGSQAASATSNMSTGSDNSSVEGLTEIIGGGAAHTHAFSASAINLAVKYCDVILASRDA